MTQERDPALEGLRGYASLSVVMGHFLFTFFPYLGHLYRPYPGAAPRYGFETWLSHPPFSCLFMADAAVSVFFVLSGYVLTLRIDPVNPLLQLRQAAVRRYFRLALPAMASVMLAWALMEAGAMQNQLAAQLGAGGWILHFYTLHFSFWSALHNGLIGAPVFGIVDLNGSLWTLQIELLGSILLFAAFALFGQNRLLLVCWFFVFANICGAQGAAVLHYLAILAGGLLGGAAPWLKRHPRAASLLFLLGLVGVSYNASPDFAWLQRMPLPQLSWIYGPNLAAAPQIVWNSLGATLLVAGVIGSPLAARLFSSRMAAHLGRLSFSMYLLHLPLLMSLGLGLARCGWQLGLSHLEFSLLSFFVYMIVLFVLSEIFHRYCDAPAMRLARWLSDRCSRRTGVGVDAVLTCGIQGMGRK